MSARDAWATAGKLRLLLAFVGVLLICWTVAGVQVAVASTTYPARKILVGKRVHCWPVATTPQQQTRGLQGIERPRYPLVFVFHPPEAVGFWMKDTPAPLTGVWISSRGLVTGYWHGKPESLTPHYPPQFVAMVIEYPAADRVPALRTRVLLEGSCQRLPAL